MPIYSLWFHVIKCRSLRPYFLRGNGSCSDSINPNSGVCRIVTYQILKEKHQQAHKLILLLASSCALHHIWVCLKIGYPMVPTGLSSCSLWKYFFGGGLSPWQTHFQQGQQASTLGPQAAMADDLNLWKLILRGKKRGRVGACGAVGNWIWFDADMLCLIYIYIYIYVWCYMMYVYIYIYKHIEDMYCIWFGFNDWWGFHGNTMEIWWGFSNDITGNNFMGIQFYEADFMGKNGPKYQL